jgi:hypothetical protein
LHDEHPTLKPLHGLHVPPVFTEYVETQVLQTVGVQVWQLENLFVHGEQ